MIEVVVIEDSHYIRGFIKEELERHSDIRVLWEAASGIAGIDLVQSFRPQVIVMDMNLPGLDGWR